MPSLKSLRLRIRSITSTQKIIKAMQMISASRLRQVRHYSEYTYIYKDSLNWLLQRALKDSQLNLSDQLWIKSFAALKHIVDTGQHIPPNLAKSIITQTDSIPLSQFATTEELRGINEKENINTYGGATQKLPDAEKLHKLLILFTTDRGLCGSYNSQLMRRVAKYIKESSSTTSVICVGKKGYDNLKKYKNITMLSDPLPCLKSKSLEYGAAHSLIIQPILTVLAKSNFSSCDIIYTEYVSTLVQKPTCFRLMPFDFMLDDNNMQTNKNYAKSANEMLKNISTQFEGIVPTYEPWIEKMLPMLLYQYIETVLYEVIIESLLSEHAARMVAMDGAYRNSKKIVDILKSQYNRGRQSNITRELIEIISGNDAIQTG